MKECVGEDGETYYEINGNWFRKVGDRMEQCSKPKVIVSCKVLDQDKEKAFFTKHLNKV